MNSRFHNINLSANRNLARYQPIARHSTAAPPRLALGLAMALFAAALSSALCAWAGPVHDEADRQGFAPPARNLFEPILGLGPEGKPELGLQAFEQTFALQRKLLLHPAASPDLQALIDRLPPRETIVIQAPTLYESKDIPWLARPPDVHYLLLAGHLDGAGYI
jgi:hypothetical protein